MFRFNSPLTLIALALATFALAGSAEASHRRHHRGHACCPAVQPPVAHGCCTQASVGHVGHQMHSQTHMGYSGHQPMMHMQHHQPAAVYAAPQRSTSSCCGGQ